MIKTDGFRIAVDTPEGETAVFLDRRMGITWPSHRSPGYFCVFGMKEEPTPFNTSPLVLLAEGLRRDRDRLYEAIIGNANKWRCKWLLADLSDDFQLITYNFGLWLRKKNVKNRELMDMSEFSSFEAARPVIDSLARRKLLRIPKDGRLWSEVAEMGPDDVRSHDAIRPEERFPAVNALNHVVCSYEVYPWQRPVPPELKVAAGGGEGYR